MNNGSVRPRGSSDPNPLQIRSNNQNAESGRRPNDEAARASARREDRNRQTKRVGRGTDASAALRARASMAERGALALAR